MRLSRRTRASAAGPSPPLVGDPVPDAPVTGEPAIGGDLDQFFDALRQVVRDVRERLPLAADDAADDAVPSQVDPVVVTPPAPTTELVPTTAELVASLEADRDLWRERAVVWRERALGADQLVKALNSHLSDLSLNLDDLRLAMRVLGGETGDAPEPCSDRYVEPGA